MNTLAFDIETIPDVATGRALYKLEDSKIPDVDVVRAMEQIQYQKSKNTFLPHYMQKIVAISVLRADKDSVKITTLQGDEAEIIKDFFSGIDRYVPCLVSWNGSGFDLPVLHYRSLLHGINAQRYWDTGGDDRDFRFNNYLSRYHWRHIDLMDVLAGFSPRAFAPLDGISKLLKLPGKQILDGSKVWEAYCEGKLQEIYDYCEIDVLNTYLIYLRFELMRGLLIKESYQKHCKNLFAYIGGSDKEHLRTYAQEWQSSCDWLSQ